MAALSPNSTSTTPAGGTAAPYFFDPSGNRNEVFAGGFIYYPDNPKRVWSIDKIGKAVFYYQRELNERFMSVVT
jgi:catechol 2,3-dioxygenase